VFPNEIYSRFFNLCDENHWDFDGNCIEHVELLYHAAKIEVIVKCNFIVKICCILKG
jgi:hypothetical protein